MTRTLHEGISESKQPQNAHAAFDTILDVTETP